jgi:hypothetical protein
MLLMVFPFAKGMGLLCFIDMFSNILNLWFICFHIIKHSPFNRFYNMENINKKQCYNLATLGIKGECFIIWFSILYISK